MIIYLKPLSLFPTLHSDTIFGALISAAKEIYPEKFQEMLDNFKKGNPPFLVSSAFPYIEGEEGRVRFFPKPLLEPQKHDDLKVLKKIKKTRYVEESIFQTWLTSGEQEIIERNDEYQMQDGLLYQKTLVSDFIFDVATIPRNTINRVTNASENIFYSSGVAMKGLGLFFMVRFRDNSYEDVLKGCLCFLKDRGFGADISVGKGHFDYEISNETPFSIDGKSFITLSRYIPLTDELNAMDDELWYELGSKRGRSSSGSLRREVKFFREGSTFKSLDKPFYGCIIESGEEAVEYGMAYPVGIGGVK